MLSLLQKIVCAVESVPVKLADFLVAIVNGVFVALGALLTVALQLLPVMPTAPPAPDSAVLSALNWAFPLGSILAGMGALVALWTFFLVVKIALRWAKAI